MSTVLPHTARPSAVPVNRWWQMLLGFVAMMAISSPQYTWTLFLHSLEGKLGASLAQLSMSSRNAFVSTESDAAVSFSAVFRRLPASESRAT